MSVVDARHDKIGRYTLFGELGVGGMATVHFGRLGGAGGFGRTVAIKRLHPQLARDPELVKMFLDEARLASRIRHPNVVATLDVVEQERELFLVMEYVHGEALSRLARAHGEGGAPPSIVAAIMTGVLHGLHAAHEAKTEDGEPLGIVHRDVSPHNILVGADGVPRLLDFGVAKAVGRLHTTKQGTLKGTLAYMAPEQLEHVPLTRLVDVYAAAVVCWELLTGRPLFAGDSEADTMRRILAGQVESPSQLAPEVPKDFDTIVRKALAADPARRYASARAMALEIERCVPVAKTTEVSEWVEEIAGHTLRTRAQRVAEIERIAVTDVPAPRRARARYAIVIALASAGVAAAAWAGVAANRSDDAHAETTRDAAIAPPQPPAPPVTEPTPAPPTLTPTPTPTPTVTPTHHAKAKKPPACDPPYFTGSDGHRHYKPECFSR